MTRTTKTRNPKTVRDVARTATNLAIGGTALAADKAFDAVDEVVERAESALRDGRREARKTVEAVTRTAQEAIGDDHGKDGGARSYEERTRDELYALAVERDIRGRSAMRKSELIAALRAER